MIVASQTVIARGVNAERRDSRFATFTLLTSMTMFAAPAVAGVLISSGTGHDAGQLRVVYALGLVLAGLSSVVSLSLVRSPGALANRPPTVAEGGRAVLAEVLGSRSVTTAIVVGFAVLSAADLLVAFMPAIGQLHGLSARQVGFLIAAHGLASVVVRLVLVRLLRRFDRRHPPHGVSRSRRRQPVVRAVRQLRAWAVPADGGQRYWHRPVPADRHRVGGRCGAS